MMLPIFQRFIIRTQVLGYCAGVQGPGTHLAWGLLSINLNIAKKEHVTFSWKIMIKTGHNFAYVTMADLP